MAQVIAGMYELQEKIGSGGGGIVYLGRHLRLDKPVVLKADKRTLSAGQETLRREVDMLKGLSQTYIPQVYDFVQEDGVVYTVMDFIDGESLDKLLVRGERPAQAQVIRWACQLLEALSYLHSRPPHGILHGDIKPANIMLRRSGDICLIDFNIALALGEDGAVKAGFSRGYASPEHYGIEYLPGSLPAEDQPAGRKGAKARRGRKSALESAGRPEKRRSSEAEESITETDSDATVADDGATEVDSALPEAGVTVAQTGRGQTSSRTGSKATGSTTEGRKAVLLDVRSDIYSLGATLYHILSGQKPAQDAREVKALGPEVCSPAVAAILKKAMAPDPTMRYQSAEEMLDAFRQLHKRDPRTLAHRRRMGVSAAALTVMFLAGGACTFVGLKQLEQRQTALTLAEYSANALESGNVDAAVAQAMQAIPSGKSILEAPVTAQAQKALTDALGVYLLEDGFRTMGTLELPATPFDMILSPGGTRLAVVYAYEAAVYDLETNECLAAFPIQKSALSDCLFLDENRIVYAGDQGITAYDLEKDSVLWTGEKAVFLAVSGDGSRVAAADRNADRALIYNTVSGTVEGECSFGELRMPVASNDIFADPKNYVFALNEDGSLLAVSFSDGSLTVFDPESPQEDLLVCEKSGYGNFAGGFCGRYFVYAADGNGGSAFTMIDVQEASVLGGYDSQEALLLKADKSGIYLAEGKLLVKIEIEDEGNGSIQMEQTELAFADNGRITAFSVGEDYVLTALDDDSVSIFDNGANLSFTENYGSANDFTLLAGQYAVLGNRNEPALRILRLEDHNEAQFLKYDARYAHEEARVSADGKHVMLFGLQGFRIYDTAGVLLVEQALPDPEQIYDQQFRKEDDSRLEVIWYDGTVRSYSAEDGSMIGETAGTPPAKDLYEEFYTDRYRIVSSLHDAPQVYDIETGELKAVLEEEAYLTYVTQAGDCLITEYISAEGLRYGLLLNSEFETLAYLPNLCDVAGDVLFFDYESGNLRQSRLYSLRELVALGDAYQSTLQKGE